MLLLKGDAHSSSRIKSLIKRGDRMAAIRLYRDYTDCSLITAKNDIDKIASHLKELDHTIVSDQIAPEVPIPDYIAEIQDIVTANLAKPSGVNKSPESVLDVIADYDKELVIEYLGDLGIHLRAFATQVNPKASLSDVQSGTLVKGGKVYNRVVETMQLAAFVKKQPNRFVEIPGVIQRWFGRNHSRIIKVLCKPPSRLLNDSECMKARKVSKPKDISLNDIYEKGRKRTWSLLPDGFVPYCRMGPGFQKEQALNEYAREVYNEMGLSNLRQATLQDEEAFEHILKLKYNGFIRVKLQDAVLLAAKSMGCEWNHPSRILIAANYFKNDFWKTDHSDKSIECDPYVSDVFDRHVMIEANYKTTKGKQHMLNLRARAYPLEQFNVRRPERVVEVIKTIENHVDASGGRLFDNIWVVVPSFSANAGKVDNYKYSDGKSSYSFFDYWDYAENVDRYLVESGQLFPVILGENTSKKSLYFVSYWA